MTAEEGADGLVSRRQWRHSSPGGLGRPRLAREAPDASAECSKGSWLPRAMSPDTQVPARHVVADGCSKVD